MRSAPTLALFVSALLVGCKNSDTDTWPDPEDSGDTSDTSDTDTGVDTDTADTADTADTSDTGITQVGPTPHCGTVTTHEIWHATGNPHLVSCDIKIEGGTVQMEPGVEVVVADGKAIKVSADGVPGSLLIQGSASEPVILRGDATALTPPSWAGIAVERYADEVSIKHAEIHAAGQGAKEAAIYVNGVVIEMQDVLINNSDKYGMKLEYEAYLTDTSTAITITNSGSYPVSSMPSHAGTLPSDNSDYTGNAVDGIRVVGGLILRGSTWNDVGVPYVVVDNIQIGGDSHRSSVLDIDPGVSVLFGVGKGITLAPSGTSGGLRVNGTSSMPVTLSSLGAATGGFWSGIKAQEGTVELALSYTTVEWAGAGAARGAIEAYFTDVLVDHVTLRTSEHMGFYLSDYARFAPGSTNLTVTGSSSVGYITADMIDSIPSGTYTGNNIDAISTSGNIVRRSVTWGDHGVPYWVTETVLVEGTAADPAVLTIDPNVVVWFSNARGMKFSSQQGAAALHAVGTSSQKIRFTAAQFAEPGAWTGLHFYDHCEEDDILLDYITVEYGGGSTGDPGNLTFNKCAPKRIDHITSQYSERNGIVLSDAPFSMLDPVYLGNYLENCSGLGCP